MTLVVLREHIRSQGKCSRRYCQTKSLYGNLGETAGSEGNKRTVWLEPGGGKEGGRFYSKADGMLLSLSRL